MRLSLLFLCVLSLTLSACGGGGGNNGEDAFFANFPGRFIGPAVAGLEYETATKAGRTGPQGQFDFEPGETITFRLGNTELGSAPAAERMSPVDLIENVKVPRTTDELVRAVYSEYRSREAQLFNLILFLQTLDADGDLANGIQIPDEVITLMAGVQIDFDLNTEDFAEHAPFRRLLFDGSQVGLWDGIKPPIRHVGKAIDAFHGYAGIQHQFEYRARMQGDQDADGTPEYEHHYLFTGEFALELLVDNDADGNADTSATQLYNPLGHLDANQYDAGNNGTIDEEEAIEYDASGDIERAMGYSNGVLRATHTFTKDELGYTRMRDDDDNADGVIDYRTTYYRDALGRIERTEEDYDVDGSPDQIRTNTYDANGHLRTRSFDNDADGNPESTATYVHDPRGRQLLYQHDAGADGSVDQEIVTEYDDIARTRRITIDNDGDGTPDVFRFTQYDAAGRRTLEMTDRDADGTTDTSTRFVYFPDRIERELDSDGDGNPDEYRTQFLNPAGNVESDYVDNDADGTPDRGEELLWERASAFQALQGLGQS